MTKPNELDMLSNIPEGCNLVFTIPKFSQVSIIYMYPYQVGDLISQDISTVDTALIG